MLLRLQERQIDPDITLIEMAGKLVLGPESRRIEETIEDLVRAGFSRVIFDMSGIDYIDSAGVGLLALAAGRFKEAKGRLVVVAPNGRVQHELKVTQMDRLVTVTDTQAAAIAILGAKDTSA
jgi:anti-sigma B factor antagonist